MLQDFCAWHKRQPAVIQMVAVWLGYLLFITLADLAAAAFTQDELLTVRKITGTIIFTSALVCALHWPLVKRAMSREQRGKMSAGKEHQG